MGQASLPSRVLLVDDSWYMHHVVRELLEPIGYEVLSARDGAEALEVYRDHQPDVVVMDIILPGLDGFEAISRIRGFDPRANIVVLTGFTTEEARQKAHRLGVSAFVPKPIRLPRLLEAIRSARAS